MNNLNSMLLEGSLTKDPEIRKDSKDKNCTWFTIATKKYFINDNEQQKDVSFFDICTRSRLADVCMEYLKKRPKCSYCGPLKTRILAG